MPSSAPYTTAFARKSLRGPGIGVDEAVEAAQKNLDGMRDRILAEVDRQLSMLKALAARLAQEDVEASAAIVEAADALTGLCASPGLLPIGEAARGVCKLADELEPPLPAEAVRMLCDTMILLREQDEAGRRGVWMQLQGDVEAAVNAVTAKRLRRLAAAPRPQDRPEQSERRPQGGLSGSC